MNVEIEALAIKLDEAEVLLRSHEQTQWADWLCKDARLIRGLDFHGIEHLLSAYGGMGSINDIVLQRSNQSGLYVATEENKRFDTLRAEIYSAAKKLKSEEY
jgi:hypothetical protein